MRIQPKVPSVSSVNKPIKPAVKKNAQSRSNQGIQKDRYIPDSSCEKNITYSQGLKNKPSICIESLKAESEEAYRSLKDIVVKLLEKQGYCTEALQTKDLDNVVVDEITRAEAAALIAEDGPLGAEAVSDRIVQFAMAISGGDKTKMSLLKGAIDKGFNEVKNMLGQLPEVSLKTYDLILEKLDRWEQDIT